MRRRPLELNLNRVANQNCFEELGITAKQASLAWDLSGQKRELLQGVSLPELKRRRFLPKEATKNPWAA